MSILGVVTATVVAAKLPNVARRNKFMMHFCDLFIDNTRLIIPRLCFQIKFRVLSCVKHKKRSSRDPTKRTGRIYIPGTLESSPAMYQSVGIDEKGETSLKLLHSASCPASLG